MYTWNGYDRNYLRNLFYELVFSSVTSDFLTLLEKCFSLSFFLTVIVIVMQGWQTIKLLN